ncbi:unnamed protein product, partial [Ixodes hexagonus]
KIFQAGSAVAINMQKERKRERNVSVILVVTNVERKRGNKMRTCRPIVILLATLTTFPKAHDLNSNAISMTALDATVLTPDVGDRLRLNYTLETKVSVIVECFKDSEPTASYYLLVPGEDSISLNSSVDIGSLKLRDRGIYVCQAGLVGEVPSSSVSWIVDVQPKIPACHTREACTEMDAHSCAQDRCVCPSSSEAFFSKNGRRQCRQRGVLTLTSRIKRLPIAMSDPLEIGYYVVTYGDCFVYWTTERVERRTVSKLFVDSHRRVSNGVFHVRRNDFSYGRTITVEACLSGTPICKAVEVDIPKRVSRIGDACTNDGQCSHVNGFCIKGVCACTDSTGKDFGRALAGVCTLSCVDHGSCSSLKHSFCFAGVCECSAGFHSWNRTCLADRCVEDTDCAANETCVSGTCLCLPGYVMEDANCVPTECVTNRDCFWKNSECISGKCICRVGYRIIAGECDRKIFGHCSQGCNTTVPDSLCGAKPWCTCKPGHVYRAQDGVVSCAPIECSRLSPCQEDHRKQCIDYVCVCANSSGPCDPHQDLALQVFKEEASVYKTVVLLLGAALTFILVASVPVVILERIR